MDNPSQSPQPELQALCTYVVIVHIQDDAHARVAGVFMRFKDAIMCLKTQRLENQNGFIEPEDAASRDQYPFRNRIGYLNRADGARVGWGYAWPNNESNCTSRAWIQKTLLWRRDDEVVDVEKLSKKELKEMEAEGDIDYIALGPGGPPNAKFDKASKDFVFEGEERYTKPYKDYSETSTRE